ncbi:MAG: fibronectin type III domain-containing protein [Oscillospiraceae bacterium]|nr:fibronectin type III domain-containing protein [Oscillospiraceae bacterium]
MTRREAHGIPTVYVCNSTYASVSQFSNEDSGMPNARRVVMDHISNFREYATHIPLRGQMVAGNAGTRVMYWYDNIVNRQQSFTPDELREYWGFADPIMASWSPVEQARWALGVYGANAPMASCGTRSLDGRLTEFERNPGITNPARLGDMDRPADRLNHRASSFTISGVNYEDAVRNFNRLAVHRDGRQGTSFNTTFVPPAFPGVQHNPEVFAFGDGLELIPPTRALVEEMLAYTDRAPDEILGKMRKRAGIITVEKIAINAVMAGSRPEYFPVILAAMEAYAGGYTYGMMFHHAFSTGGPYGFVMVLAGPIVEELGILDDDRSGTSGAGNQTLNTIGRAIRMSIRNIGHNRVPDIDTTGRVGKRNDHVIDFFAENMSALPEGWRPHSEMMGFPAGSSTISMKEFNTIFSLREFGQFAAEPFAWTTSEALAQLRSRIAGGFSNIILIPPALAAELQYEGVSTVEELKVALRPTATGAGANTFNFWPIVVGTDPGVHRTYTLDTAAHTTYVTNLIVRPGGPIAPSAPTNFNVTYSPDRTSATLTWDVPDRIGGAPIIAFDVSGVHGLTTVFTPPNAEDFVNNGLPNITSAMLAGSGQFQGMSLTRLPATARSHTFHNLDPDAQGFFMVRAVNGVRNNAGIQGMANNLNAVYAPDAFNLRESGVGSWAHFAEAPIDLVTGNGLGRRDPNGTPRGALGTTRHFRAPWLDNNVYYPLATLVGAPASDLEPVTPNTALFDALMTDGFVAGNQIATLRTQLEAIANEYPAYIALTYDSRWFSHLRNGRGRLDVTITSANADASDAFVLAYCRISNTTKAINEAGFLGDIDGLTPRGMVGTGAVANWAVNTGVFNHANYAFFATEPGTYTITFTLRDIANNVDLVSEDLTVTVTGSIATLNGLITVAAPLSRTWTATMTDGDYGTLMQSSGDAAVGTQVMLTINERAGYDLIDLIITGADIDLESVMIDLTNKIIIFEVSEGLDLLSVVVTTTWLPYHQYTHSE